MKDDNILDAFKQTDAYKIQSTLEAEQIERVMRKSKRMF